MKALKIVAIVLFALIFTASVSAFLYCYFTPQGKQWRQKQVLPEASHVMNESR